MHIVFVPMGEADTDDLVGFMSSNRFPFHLQATPEARNIRVTMEKGHFWSDDAQGYWIVMDGRRIGIVALEDLPDEDAPLFDLRLAESQRGKGLGQEVLRALCNMVFTSMPNTMRFEGKTREDNIAMRTTFLRSGFLKEAHDRLAWPTNDGRHVAAIAYAILRQDWESGTATPFEWDDIKI